MFSPRKFSDPSLPPPRAWWEIVALVSIAAAALGVIALLAGCCETLGCATRPPVAAVTIRHQLAEKVIDRARRNARVEMGVEEVRDGEQYNAAKEWGAIAEAVAVLDSMADEETGVSCP